MRTYDRATIEQSRESWRGFGWQWDEIRRLAADRGYLYAPGGSAEDDRDADQPSQRAIIWRALIDNPKQTESIVRRSGSWSQVVDRIIGMEERLRLEADELAADTAWGRRDEPTPRSAPMAIKAIIQRIADS